MVPGGGENNVNVSARERVLCALRHEQPDVTPWQINLTADAHDQTAAHLGDPGFASLIGNHLASYSDGWFEEIRPGYWRDQFGVVWNRTIDRDIGNVCAYQFPQPEIGLYEFPVPDLARNRVGLERLTRENRDRLTVAEIGFSMFERAWTLRGMEALLMDMLDHPAFVDALLDRILAYNLQAIEQIVTYPVDCVYFGDDWGQQRGTIMGPRLWRRFIKPRVSEMYARVKAAGKYVMQHSCGDVQALFPDLIDMGLDIFNTFQPEVMNVDWCKREYGSHLTFYGGISTQQVLPRISAAELPEHIRGMIARIGSGGGYIVAPTHAIPRDVPPENIVAFIETVRSQ
ncbi:MAG: uroporphyrinogen decarboxylase [Chloroflexi bacterium]|nr:uroporphyrinogen decarboxylase [Chloroflexota bacterium]